MTDIVERLRDQGKDAFSRHYSLGTFKLCDEAASEIEHLRLEHQHACQEIGVTVEERDQARAECDHWRALVPRADRAQFPFDATVHRGSPKV